MSLNDIQTGRKMKPLAVMLYGVAGVGKTTWGMSAPKPINLGAEPNDEIEGARFPVCKTYAEFLSRISELKGSHDYKTLVIDTIDSVEKLVHEEIVSGDKAKSIITACGGYGKGPKESARKLMLLRSQLDDLRDNRGMNIILLAHAAKVKFEDPMTPEISYDTYQPKLHVDSRGDGALTVFTEWVGSILFANFNVASTEKDGKKFVMGVGDRRIFTEKRPGYDAKNRYKLAHEMGLNWSEFAHGVKSFYAGNKPHENQPLPSNSMGSAPDPVKLQDRNDNISSGANAPQSPSYGVAKDCIDYVGTLGDSGMSLKFIAYVDLNYQNAELITHLRELVGKLKARNEPEFSKKVIGFINEKCGNSLDNLLRIKSKVDKATQS